MHIRRSISRSDKDPSELLSGGVLARELRNSVARPMAGYWHEISAPGIEISLKTLINFEVGEASLFGNSRLESSGATLSVSISPETYDPRTYPTVSAFRVSNFHEVCQDLPFALPID